MTPPRNPLASRALVASTTACSSIVGMALGGLDTAICALEGDLIDPKNGSRMS
jgi:hypothetical protein